MTLLIHTSPFPPIHLLALMLHSEKTVIDRTENYQKGSARNRYLLGTHQGYQLLSIPLQKGKNQQMPIAKVRIANGTQWRTQHSRTLQTAYGKSPFFPYYKEGLFEVLLEPCNDLSEFNDRAFGFICSALQVSISLFRMEKSIALSEENVIDVRNFKIRHWQQLQANPPYEQVYGGKFLSNLCVLDLLFHMGPESGPYLQSWTPHLIPVPSSCST
ncbi:MAG: WbqC family protein [Saprospiraceae bacterium]|nr:WbqC family protein [Saprospiraceae bacterium]